MSLTRLQIYCFGLLVVIVFVPMRVTQAQESLTLEIHPYLAATELIKRFTPLADYLSKKIGQPITVTIAGNYQEHIDQIGNDMVDIAYMGPASYVRMVDLYGKKTILACLEINERPTFHGVIIVSKDNPIRTLSDLAGKRFAFGDPASTMSHLVPRYMMRQAGVTIDKLVDHVFLKNHHNVALGVLLGNFDAGAVKEEVFDEYRQQGLKMLKRTPPISEHLFVVRKTLPPETVEALRNGLYVLKNDPEGLAIMTAVKENVTGMVPAIDSDYDNLRSILKTLKDIVNQTE